MSPEFAHPCKSQAAPGGVCHQQCAHRRQPALPAPRHCSPHGPRRSPRVNLGWEKLQTAIDGAENQSVRIDVFGEFPDASIHSLLGVEDVERAMKRHVPEDLYDWAQKRLAAFAPAVMRRARKTDIAARAARGQQAWVGPDGELPLVFVDDTRIVRCNPLRSTDAIEAPSP